MLSFVTSQVKIEPHRAIEIAEVRTHSRALTWPSSGPANWLSGTSCPRRGGTVVSGGDASVVAVPLPVVPPPRRSPPTVAVDAVNVLYLCPRPVFSTREHGISFTRSTQTLPVRAANRRGPGGRDTLGEGRPLRKEPPARVSSVHARSGGSS